MRYESDKQKKGRRGQTTALHAHAGTCTKGVTHYKMSTYTNDNRRRTNTMAPSTTPARLLGYLALYGRAYPDVWTMAETLRSRQRDIGVEVAPWCYLPTSAWMAVVAAHHGEMTPKNAPVFITDCTALAALSGWRYTQGIYRFNSEIYTALLDTAPSGDMPASVLMHLPEWCVYIEMPDGIHGAFDGICGMFVHLDHGDDTNACDFRVVLDFGDRLGQPINMAMGSWSIAEGIERTRAAIAAEHPDAAEDFDAEFISQSTAVANAAVSLALYLCSDEPEISGHTPGSGPHYPAYKKTKRGMQLFPPDKPRIWRIGDEIGATIAHGRTIAHGIERKGPRPHMRRGHWHGFWAGPIKPRPEIENQPARRFGYKWLPPMVVGIGEDDGN